MHASSLKRNTHTHMEINSVGITLTRVFSKVRMEIRPHSNISAYLREILLQCNSKEFAFNTNALDPFKKKYVRKCDTLQSFNHHKDAGMEKNKNKTWKGSIGDNPKKTITSRREEAAPSWARATAAPTCHRGEEAV